jgi:hypothetical protein
VNKTNKNRSEVAAVPGDVCPTPLKKIKIKIKIKIGTTRCSNKVPGLMLHIMW